MTAHARAALASTIALVVLGLLALSATADASFGPESFEAGTCNNHTCTYASVEANRKEAVTQAASHPAWGITTFVMKHSGTSIEGASVKRIRVDVPPGLAADPEAPQPDCSVTQFQSNPKGCPASSEVGTTEMEAVAEPLGIPLALPSLSGTVYNLAPPAGSGLPLDFGIAVEPGGELVSPIRLFLEGHVDWSGDYHEYFEINNVPNEAEVKALLGMKSPLKVLKSKLNFNGHAGGNFLTLPSVCSSSTTSHLELESWTKEKATAETHTPVGVDGCGSVPFAPSTTVTPENAAPDAPDGATTVVQVPQKTHESEINTSDIKDARVVLPEGLTLNPSAAHGLEACSAAQIGIGTTAPVACPAGSRVGAVTIETDLPPHSLTGSVFLGGPTGGPITNPPYTLYLDAESTMGVSVRLQGSVTPNPSTGRLEVTFANNPQLPFSELILTLNGGARAPLANPLTCTAASTDYEFTPYTAFPEPGGVGGGATAIGATPFAIGGCPSSPPFALAQSTVDSSNSAGAYTHYTLNLARAEGQQYVSHVSTVLPPGLAGAIPSVPLCGEPQAQLGTCPASSLIGTATVYSGSGSEPYAFSGAVFLTGPYQGAPYGLSIPVNAAAGPFQLGTLTTRASISVDPHTARVIVSASVPTIYKGVPLRLRYISVAVTRENFLFNPTNCGGLSTDSTLSSTLGATQGLSSPFAVTNCNALAFKPSFSAATSASTNPATLKANGAALRVNLLQGAHQANLRSVVAELPKSLPSRLTTLQKACPEATYAANPYSCPSSSKVGSVIVTTPVLAEPLKGPAYLVSHGGAAFPNLDLLLEGDNGVRVILEGATNIKHGITTSTFGSIPDVPVSSFVLELPSGPNSALTAVGALCTQTLTMPTTITAQSGVAIKQATQIAVAGCTGGRGRTRIKILSKRIVRGKLVLRVQIFAAGRVSVKSGDLRTTYRRFKKAGKYTIKAPLSRRGVGAQRAHRLRFKLRVGFVPASKAESVSIAYTSIGFAAKAKGKHKR
ncbi:MAG TPA: hypothetical protein VK707_07835 [Solirubrobacteraceae bacterium]|jgi:hypothetical protein|nr:hypothetical protein [Solirubrobacteraceae bacterium]